MADFENTRSNLANGRLASEQARLELSASVYRLKQLEKDRNELERQKGGNNPFYLRRISELEHSIADEKARQEKHRQQYSSARDQLSRFEKEFELFVDPRRELGAHFSNTIPFLLFPLRMETRFKTLDNKNQLWVRVYPDECLVDSFEPLLSKKEVENVARFWAEYYSAGTSADPNNPDPEVTKLQKASWALLVSTSSAGRAAWITQQLKPDVSKSVFPLRGNNSVILAISTDNWDPLNQAAIFNLFTKLWYADGNENLIKQIKQQFNAANPGLDADKIIETYRPINFDDNLPLEIKKREDADLKVAVAVFSDLEKVSGKEHGWSQPSQVKLMPERLALIRFKNGQPMEPVFGNTIPYPLHTSPDPSEDAEAQFKQTPQGDIEFAEDIKWVADFDKAVSIGMGFKIDLAADEANGFEKLMVLGVKLGSDALNGKAQLEELFDHHYFSKKGFTILTQGTPTNNTEAASSGYSSKEDPDNTFDQYFLHKNGFNEEIEITSKKDGQWLAEWLGIDYTVVKKVLNSGAFDQADARNMNIALWPATIGYVLESLMEGGFSGETLLRLRGFFNDFVSGRGPVPAIRIGNQPYGILPAAAFNRLQWMNVGPNEGFIFAANSNAEQLFLSNLYQLLIKMDNYWKQNMLNGVPFVGKGSVSPYQDLLDIIGLHPNSVEFYRRYLESLIEMKNKMSLIKEGYLMNSETVSGAVNLLHETLGYNTDILPQIAALLGVPWQISKKIIIDDQPVAEDKKIREYTADHKNYVEALIDQAKKGENALRTGEGFSESPLAELYRLLKYALELGYHKSSMDAAEEKNAFDKAKIASMRTEKAFTHQLLNGEVTESRYALLYDTVPAISPAQTVSEFIRDSLLLAEVPFFSKYLSSQIKALENLKDASTARLERAFVEHLDTCSYRLDAWKTSILTNELSYMRSNQPGMHWDRRQMGIYLGAFGWLENVKPETDKILTPKEIPQDLIDDFNPEGDKVFVTDAANEGYIHAPSLNQAVTAAVLRNGYVSHGKPDSNNVLAVNLSSERIRQALLVIEGIQAGQSLPALLGYYFERVLHNRSDLTGKKIDSIIYAVRKIFPLNAEKLKDTKVENTGDPSVDPETVPITAVEARNVVHGLNLANHLKNQTDPLKKKYPFGLALPGTESIVADAVTGTVEQLIDISDAVADLGMAESVHHIVMGNYDRAAGVLESYSKGNYPQEPDVIRTPRSGATLTHRVSISFQYVPLNIGSGPRAQSEPSVNQWLASVLPPLDKIVCQYSFTSRATGAVIKDKVSLQTIGLEPIDLIYILNAADSSALNELDDRVLFYLESLGDVMIDGDVVISYIEESADASEFPVFQIMPIVKSLRALITESNPLSPGDIVLPNEAVKNDLPSPELPAQRAHDLIDKLKLILKAASDPGGIVNELRSLPDFITAAEAQLEIIRQNAENDIKSLASFLLQLGSFGIQQTGIGELYTTRRQWYEALKKKIKDTIDRWQKKLDSYALLAADPIPNEEKLLSMERIISTTSTTGITLAAVQAKKALFDAEFNKLNLISNTRYSSVFDLIQAVRLVNTPPFDPDPLDISAELKHIPVFIYNMQSRIKSLIDDLENKKIPTAETIIASLPGLSIEDQVKQTGSAVKIILGEQFKMFPRYSMPGDLQAEVSNSWNDTGNLLNHLKTAEGRLNPLEDWLHGIARVHDKMKHLENCILLRDAYGLDENSLVMHPVQLPYKTEKYHWMAMPFPVEDVNLEEGNTLLYTVFTNGAAAAPNEVCGLLADEWVEIIPAAEETTGITFHYDRPNCESPQTLLLVTPTRLSGNWEWNDIVDALIYALDASKLRAVSPEQIEKTPFTTFLPAVIGAESLYPYSIVLDANVHYMSEEAVKNFDKP